jgi:tRNA (mo5U34)-methyltransferase
MSASAPPKGYGPEWNKLLHQTGWWHSFELADGSVIRGVNSLESLKDRAAAFPIPQDLRARRVLDIGAWDGWFSFEMERRGADVVAIDCFDNPRFREIHAIYKSRVDYRQMDVYEITPQSVGRFDYVLFLGVLYHLKHPLLALERVCAVTKEMAIVDSFVLRDSFDPNATPVLEFYETDEMEGQTDNWVAPNLACLMAMSRTAGFARVDLCKIFPYSAALACYRRWAPENPDGPASGNVVDLKSAVHNANSGINFDTWRDDYVTVGFSTAELALKLVDVQPSVDGFGVRPLSVNHVNGELWQANFKLPPGLAAGWHRVCVAVRGGPASNAHRIAVDVPLLGAEPRIESALDGTTWVKHSLDLNEGRVISLWCAGLPENADRHNLRVSVNGTLCPVEFVADGGSGNEARQINARVPEGVAAGHAEVVVQLGTAASDPVMIEIVSPR